MSNAIQTYRGASLLWASLPPKEKKRIREWFPTFAPSLRPRFSFFKWLYSFRYIRNLDTGREHLYIGSHFNQGQKGLTFSEVCSILDLPHKELQPACWDKPPSPEVLASNPRYVACYPHSYGLRVKAIPDVQISEYPHNFSWDNYNTPEPIKPQIRQPPKPFTPGKMLLGKIPTSPKPAPQSKPFVPPKPRKS